MHVNSHKTLRQFSQKAHDNGATSVACQRWNEDQKNKTNQKADRHSVVLSGQKRHTRDLRYSRINIRYQHITDIWEIGLIEKKLYKADIRKVLLTKKRLIVQFGILFPESTGRPLGNDSFEKKLEATICGIPLASKKLGRKPKTLG